MRTWLVALQLLLFLCSVTRDVCGQFADVAGIVGALPQAPKSQVSWGLSHRVVAPGQELLVALTLRHPEGWHSYYRHSGGPEQPLQVRWHLPSGWVAGDPQWPVPSVKDGFFGKSFIHEGEVTILIPLQVPRDAAVGQGVRLAADATWQICSDGCVEESGSLDANVAVAADPAEDAAVAEVIARARAAQPLPTPKDWQVAVQRLPGSDHLRIRLVLPAGSTWQPTDAVPDVGFVTSVSGGGRLQRVDGGWEMELPAVRENSLGQPVVPGEVFSGVMLGDPAYRVGPLPVSSEPSALGGEGESEVSASQPVAASSSAAPTGWLVYGLMFLGGLILNLMPCVFPVIGLKIMGFVQHSSGDRRKILIHGWVFTLGVWASFAVIAGGLWFLRSSGGNSASWGYQLEDPRIVFALLLLMWLLALNLAGLFEIGTSATSVGGRLLQRNDWVGTFFSGVLATVVATPCSAPYLGSGMAVAVTLPPLGYTVAFASMATGLALPYLVLCAYPGLVDRLPRPGAWMLRFKQGMSFLLFATVAYLMWVYAGQIGLDSLLLSLFALVLVAFAAWVYGSWFLPHHTRRVRVIACITSLTTAGCGVWLGYPPPAHISPEQLEVRIDWRDWSQQSVDAALAAGHPVYVDFTARWCATCQFNKKRAYPPEVVRLMREKGVIAFRADKTKPNPEIDAALDRLGRVAIPVNTLQAPGQAVQILPELLSADDVTAALRALPTHTPFAP